MSAPPDSEKGSCGDRGRSSDVPGTSRAPHRSRRRYDGLWRSGQRARGSGADPADETESGDRGYYAEGSGGLDLIKDMRAQEIDVPVLVLSMHDESLYAERAFRAGASGYITKHEASAKVMTAIRQVLRGEIYLDSEIMDGSFKDRRRRYGRDGTADRPTNRPRAGGIRVDWPGTNHARNWRPTACRPNDRRYLPGPH